MSVMKRILYYLSLIIVALFISGVIIVGALYQLFSVDTVTDEEVIMSFQDNRQDFVIAKDNILRNKDIQNIRADSYDESQKSLAKIFQKLEYGGIDKFENNDYVWFVRVAKFGSQKGIVFSATGYEPYGPYYNQVIKIEDGWSPKTKMA